MNNPADTLAALAESVLAARSHLGARRPDERHDPEDAKQWDDLTAAAAALASLKGEAEPRKPDGYAYRYPHHDGDTVIRFTCGQEINGARPIEAVPYFYTTPPAPQAVIEQAARYGWQHSDWTWEAVKGGLDRFNPTPSPAPQGGGEVVQQDAKRALGFVYDHLCALDNGDIPLESYPQRVVDALAGAGWAVVPCALPFETLGTAAMMQETGNPKFMWDYLVAQTRIYPRTAPDASISAAYATPPAQQPASAWCACGPSACEGAAGCRWAKMREAGWQQPGEVAEARDEYCPKCGTTPCRREPSQPAQQPGEVGDLKAENRRLRDALAKIEGLLTAALAPKGKGNAD